MISMSGDSQYKKQPSTVAVCFLPITQALSRPLGLFICEEKSNGSEACTVALNEIVAMGDVNKELEQGKRVAVYSGELITELNCTSHISLKSWIHLCSLPTSILTSNTLARHHCANPALASWISLFQQKTAR